MKIVLLPVFACMVLAVTAWSTPFYPVRQYRAVPHRVLSPPHYARHAYHQPTTSQQESKEEEENSDQQRAKREHLDDYGKDFFHEQEPPPSHESEDKGVTGPVHTFVKTDKNANYKWGVRHHVGNKYAS